VTLTTETLVAEITVTAQAVCWHPVGADDADQPGDHLAVFPHAILCKRLVTVRYQRYAEIQSNTRRRAP